MEAASSGSAVNEEPAAKVVQLLRHHVPDGPDQQDRDTALAGSDPLVGNDWIHGYDAEEAPMS